MLTMLGLVKRHPHEATALARDVWPATRKLGGSQLTRQIKYYAEKYGIAVAISIILSFALYWGLIRKKNTARTQGIVGEQKNAEQEQATGAKELVRQEATKLFGDANGKTYFVERGARLPLAIHVNDTYMLIMDYGRNFYMAYKADILKDRYFTYPISGALEDTYWYNDQLKRFTEEQLELVKERCPEFKKDDDIIYHNYGTRDHIIYTCGDEKGEIGMVDRRYGYFDSSLYSNHYTKKLLKQCAEGTYKEAKRKPLKIDNPRSILEHVVEYIGEEFIADNAVDIKIPAFSNYVVYKTKEYVLLANGSSCVMTYISDFNDKKYLWYPIFLRGNIYDTFFSYKLNRKPDRLPDKNNHIPEVHRNNATDIFIVCELGRWSINYTVDGIQHQRINEDDIYGLPFAFGQPKQYHEIIQNALFTQKPYILRARMLFGTRDIARFFQAIWRRMANGTDARICGT